MNESRTVLCSGKSLARRAVVEDAGCGGSGAQTPPSTGRISAAGISAAGVSSALVAIMPKCPLCWMALAGTLGLDSWVLQGWILPAVGILLAAVLAALLLRARSRGSYGPFWLALIAATAMYGLKFGNGPEAGVYLSGAMLLGASVWNALPKRADRCCG